MKRNTPITLCLLPALAACGMVQSTHLGPSSGEPLRAELTYPLPRVLVKAEVHELKNGQYILKEVKRELTTDPNHIYALSFTPSFLSDDELKLEVDQATGYLSLVDAKATDRSLDAVTKGVETFATFFSGLDEQLSESTKVGDVPDFDPHTELDRVNADLQRYGISIACDACAPPAPSGPVIDGFYSRPSVTIRLTVSDRAGATLQTFSLASPNGSRLVVSPVNRSVGVTRTVKYEAFSEGEPTKVSINKPSEALGVVTGIGEIVGAVIASPIKGATDELNITNARTEATQAETERLSAEAERVEALQRVRAANEEPDNPPDGE